MQEVEIDPEIARQLKEAEAQAKAELKAGLLQHIHISSRSLRELEEMYHETDPDLEFDADEAREGMIILERQMEIMRNQSLPKAGTDPDIDLQLTQARAQAEEELADGQLQHIRISDASMREAKKIHSDLSPDIAFDENVMRNEMIIQERLMQIMVNKPLPQKTPPSEQSVQLSEPKGAQVRKEPSTVRCPKCRSAQFTAQRQGFGLGKAAVGGVLTGGVGLLAGFIGSRKVKVTCLNCGHSWKPGA